MSGSFLDGIPDLASVAIYDLATGQRVSHSAALVSAAAGPDHPLARFFQRWIEIDPVTRTGLVFAPGGDHFRSGSY
ncbi:MAG TPA: hypothetical protein VEP66_16640 [Myxococcales bacterium]|nr:hypothetical protein [Myxococcales bacterium]